MESNDALEILKHPSFPQMLSERPELALRLKTVQDELHNIILMSSQELAGVMRRCGPAVQNQLTTRVHHSDFATMRAASQKRELDTRATQRAAEGCVVSVVANVANPDWDPCDPNTYRALEESLLWKILNLDLGSG